MIGVEEPANGEPQSRPAAVEEVTRCAFSNQGGHTMIRWKAMLAAAAADVVSGFLLVLTASAQAAIPGWSTSDGPMKVGIEHGIGTEGRTALCAHPPTARVAEPQPVSPKLRSSNTFAGQDIKADRYRGKRIRISADVFAEHLAGFGLVGVRVMVVRAPPVLATPDRKYERLGARTLGS